jgi:hypothetical protein
LVWLGVTKIGTLAITLKAPKTTLIAQTPIFILILITCVVSKKIQKIAYLIIIFKMK